MANENKTISWNSFKITFLLRGIFICVGALCVLCRNWHFSMQRVNKYALKWSWDDGCNSACVFDNSNKGDPQRMCYLTFMFPLTQSIYFTATEQDGFLWSFSTEELGCKCFIFRLGLKIIYDIKALYKYLLLVELK